MAWIGVECGTVGAWELRKWSSHIRGCGGAAVADLLERMARVVEGAGVGAEGCDDRMREVEARAARAVEDVRAAAARKAAAIVGRVAADGVALGAVMSAAGMDGWRAGSAAGGRNGGMAKKRRRLAGRGVRGADGEVVSSAEAGALPEGIANTVARDARYGGTWEGWAGVELRKEGLKMSHVARGIGLDIPEAWRHVSGWTRHWRREGLAGRQFGGPRPGWEERLEQARRAAMNIGGRGARVVLNGTGDIGARGEPAGGGTGREGGQAV